MPLTACLTCGELVKAPRFGRCEPCARGYDAGNRYRRHHVQGKPWPKKLRTPLQNSRAWRGLSMRIRSEQPWCSNCGTQGSTSNPLTVDHLDPVGRGGEVLADEDRLQVLCKRCNSEAGDTPHERGPYAA